MARYERFIHSKLAAMVSAIALALFALAGSLDVPVSPVQIGTATSGQWQARAVASDGRDFLAVWDDTRIQSLGLHVALVRGGVASPAIALGPNDAADAAAVWSGDAYVVAWLEARDRFSPTYTRVARFSAAGELLGVVEGLLGVKAPQPESVAMAVGGRGVLVAWLSSSGIAVQRLDGGGRVAAESTIARRELHRVRLVRSGGGFVLLAQKERRGVVAWRLDGGGAPIGGEVAVTDDTPTAGTYGAAAVGPQIIVNSITDWSFGHLPMLRTRIVDSDLRGGRQLPDVVVPVAFVNADLTCEAGCRAIVSAANAFVNPAGSRTAGVDPLRDLLGPFEELVAGYSDPPRLAWNGEKYFVLSSGFPTLQGFDCDASLHPITAPRNVVVEARQQSHVAAASRGSSALLFWQEGLVVNDATDLMAASFDGQRLSAPRTLARGVVARIAPVVAAADFGYVAVWIASGAINVLRVSDSGAPIDAAPLAVASPTFPTRGLGVAVAGSTILVVWNDEQHVLGRLISTGGAILNAAPFVFGDGWSPDVASNGTEFAVVWTAGLGGLLAKRLTSGGTILDASVLGIGSSSGFPPHIASDGRDFLVAYSSVSADRVTRVPATGRTLQTYEFTSNFSPELAIGGAPGRYVVVGATNFRFSGPSIIDEFDSSGVLQAATATSWTNVDSAAVVPLDGGRRFLILSSREDDHDPWNLPRRAFYRVIEVSP